MSQHAFTPSPYQSPREWYQQALQMRGFQADDAQAAAIDRLEQLYQALLVFKKKRHRPLAMLLPDPAVPRGVYLWGGVGRGKSFLMDAFFSCLPYKRKQRIHFHHFMFDLHAELRELRGSDDVLLQVADRIARKYRVICFDEFHVSDIADAMLLGRLLEALFERGLVFVMTSNYPPDGLYPNGLQRENFLPTIALLKQQLDILNVDSGRDYRMRSLTRVATYLTPAGESADAELGRVFDDVATGRDDKPALSIEGRTVTARRAAPGVVWFDFAALCQTDRSQVDYLQLARSYHTVLLSGVPQMGENMHNAARRFTWLVDICYDQRVKLFMSAAVPAEQLYPEGRFANEFVRTVSRLQEMQSSEYLALQHLA
ncbi:cell division protein ZapE [Leeia aquatica]|uniref:Cell division protein ZapE n=1 Tax=Leeia aquatica TaxID=2725557 RepID=A0A847S3U7_9NEIS|nr:cell division protein ZapE [Leeia aquatica]NLR73837.1 cell division protein ZapE [Leeia aquatica]